MKRFGQGQTPTGNPFRRIGVRARKPVRKAWNGELGWPVWFRKCVNAGHDTNVADIVPYAGPTTDRYQCVTCDRQDFLPTSPVPPPVKP